MVFPSTFQLFQDAPTQAVNDIKKEALVLRGDPAVMPSRPQNGKTKSTRKTNSQPSKGAVRRSKKVGPQEISRVPSQQAKLKHREATKTVTNKKTRQNRHRLLGCLFRRNSRSPLLITEREIEKDTPPQEDSPPPLENDILAMIDPVQQGLPCEIGVNDFSTTLQTLEMHLGSALKDASNDIFSVVSSVLDKGTECSEVFALVDEPKMPPTGATVDATPTATAALVPTSPKSEVEKSLKREVQIPPKSEVEQSLKREVQIPPKSEVEQSLKREVQIPPKSEVVKSRKREVPTSPKREVPISPKRAVHFGENGEHQDEESYTQSTIERDASNCPSIFSQSNTHFSQSTAQTILKPSRTYDTATENDSKDFVSNNRRSFPMSILTFPSEDDTYEKKKNTICWFEGANGKCISYQTKAGGCAIDDTWDVDPFDHCNGMILDDDEESMISKRSKNWFWGNKKVEPIKPMKPMKPFKPRKPTRTKPNENWLRWNDDEVHQVQEAVETMLLVDMFSPVVKSVAIGNDIYANGPILSDIEEISYDDGTRSYTTTSYATKSYTTKSYSVL